MKLTIKDLQEIIAATNGQPERIAILCHALASNELERRVASGKRGGRPRKENTKRREQLRAAQQRFAAKKKEKDDSRVDYEMDADFGA